MVLDLLVTERLPAHLEELELNSSAVLKDVKYVVYTAKYADVDRGRYYQLQSAAI